MKKSVLKKSIFKRGNCINEALENKMDESLTEDRSLARPIKKDIKRSYKVFDRARDNVRSRNDEISKRWQNISGSPMDDKFKNILLTKDPDLDFYMPSYNDIEKEDYPFYVTYYKETPYYHPEEGGYYIAGRYADYSKGFDSKEEAKQFAKELADKEGLNKINDTYYNKPSKYIGEEEDIWVETARDYLSREKGDEMYESLSESSKDVSIDKMSKKDRKAFYDKQRNTWGRNPMTRTKPSDKIYDRKKFKKDDLNESEGEKRTIIPDKNYHVLHWVTGEDKARDYGNLPGKDIKGMLRGYKYEDDLDMWFSKNGNSGYFITEINESLDEADEANKDENKNSNKCPNCGRNLIKDSTGFHCPVCDKKNNSSEFNTSSISKGAVSEEYEVDDTFDKADFEPHNKDEYEFKHDDDIKGIEEIKL